MGLHTSSASGKIEVASWRSTNNTLALTICNLGKVFFVTRTAAHDDAMMMPLGVVNNVFLLLAVYLLCLCCVCVVIVKVQQPQTVIPVNC